MIINLCSRVAVICLGTKRKVRYGRDTVKMYRLINCSFRLHQHPYVASSHLSCRKQNCICNLSSCYSEQVHILIYSSPQASSMAWRVMFLRHIFIVKHTHGRVASSSTFQQRRGPSFAFNKWARKKNHTLTRAIWLLFQVLLSTNVVLLPMPAIWYP